MPEELIINGYGKPVFVKITRTGDAPGTETWYRLPACNSEGEPETSKSEALIERVRYSGKITRKKRLSGGVRRKSWKLIYKQYISGGACLMLMEILNANDDPDRFILHFIPYDDKEERRFPAYISSKDITLDILKGGAKANGMYLVGEIEVTALELSSIDWVGATPQPVDYSGSGLPGPSEGFIET